MCNDIRASTRLISDLKAIIETFWLLALVSSYLVLFFCSSVAIVNLLCPESFESWSILDFLPSFFYSLAIFITHRYILMGSIDGDMLSGFQYHINPIWRKQ